MWPGRGRIRQSREETQEGLSQLAAGLAVHATLIIAKLNRLAANVHSVFGWMESGVEFVGTNMSTVDPLTIYILTTVAEEEARMISPDLRLRSLPAFRRVWLGTPNLAVCFPAQARTANAVKTGWATDRWKPTTSSASKTTKLERTKFRR